MGTSYREGWASGQEEKMSPRESCVSPLTPRRAVARAGGSSLTKACAGWKDFKCVNSRCGVKKLFKKDIPSFGRECFVVDSKNP